MLTAGIHVLGPRAILAVAPAVEALDAFTPDNDPHGGHDFGTFEWQGDRLIWKIDTHDRTLAYRPPDPTGLAVTTRVLTIMLPEEY